MLFTGFSAFPLTPTHRDGSLNAAELRNVLEPILAAKVDSIGLLGSTGAYPYLSTETRKETLRTALDHVSGAVPLVVGIASMRTDMAADLAIDAQTAGADGLLMAPLSYQILTDAEVYQHYATVANATDLPLCIYNNPGTTQFRFGDDLIARLAALPTIKAIKMPLPTDGDFRGEISRLRAITPEDFQIGYSGDWGCADALLAGAACWHSAVGGIIPAQCRAFADAARAGDAERTAELSKAFTPLWEITKTHGSYRVSYAIAKVKGITKATPLLPVRPLSDDQHGEIAKALEAIDLALA